MTAGARSKAVAPAIQALLLQILALTLLTGCGYALSFYSAWRPTVLHAALAQGVLAALLAWARKMAIWWIPIQLAFPVAAIVVLAWQLPPSIFLGAFLVLAGLYWSTYRTQVPYYPSGPMVRQAVLRLLAQDRPVRFVDIGSGFGGLVLQLARCRPDCDCFGIELAPLPWLASRLRALATGSRARFLRGDYANLDFADFDVVFAYLSPAAMPALWRKARAEMRKDSLLLSYEFAIPGAEPDLTLQPQGRGPVLYGWRF